jgi:hypothetical protein
MKTNKRNSFLFGTLWLTANLLGCHTPSDSESSAGPAEPINSTTVLPASFAEEGSGPTAIAVPLNLVNAAVVERQTAEVREGPGTEFALDEQLLKKGDLVVLFEKIDNWQKILCPYKDIEGWVHYRTLGEAEKNAKLVELNLLRLPKVFAAHEISEAWDEPTRKQIAVSIPKGSNFPALKFDDAKTLVYLVQSNSPIWLSRKDAQ